MKYLLITFFLVLLSVLAAALSFLMCYLPFLTMQNNWADMTIWIWIIMLMIIMVVLEKEYI